jgi:PAS domain S-box-containing protein
MISEQPASATGLLSEREGLYRTLVSALPDGIVVTDLMGMIVFASPTAVKVFGCAHENELVRQSVLDWVATDERTRMNINLRYIIAEGRPRQTDFTLLKVGGAFSAELNAAVVRSAEGVPEGAIFVVRDVTERKRIESTLAQEAIRRRILIEQSKDGIAVLDLDGKLHETNASFTRMLGYGPEEMATLHVWDWDAQWTREELLSKLRDIENKSATFETRHRRKDGSLYDVEISASGAEWNSQTFLYCVSRDISDRKAAERSLHERQAKLDGILRTAPIGIAVVVDRVMVEVNATFCRMIGYTAEELIGNSARMFYASQEDFDFVGREAYRELEQRQVRTVETKWRNKQGEVIHVLASASPIDRNDFSQGVVFTALDITARRQAEQEVEKLHKQLLLASRQAGMAEVATSVLHNVGNVLNSINVSTAVVTEKLKGSKVGSLAQLGTLLDTHAHDLATFITSDPVGKELPAYINRLAARLADERTFLLKEVDLIRNNIEHIRDIVSMQQSYAKVFGASEKIKVPELVEDALRMNAGALVRHDVQVKREYDPRIPEIVVEKHKVLQILVNLIRNAKYACDESGRKDKLLTLRLGHNGERVSISVIDNGVGIPAENMTRIFNHGFTTRKEGHGFGLHSAALAATELGGSLVAHSDGPQKGATFTLELPMLPPATNG